MKKKSTEKNSKGNNYKVKKRQEIIDVALQAFANNGFANTTIADIAKQAGVSEATIYEYFQNKEDLLFTLPEQYFAELNKSLDIHFLGVEGIKNLFRKFIWHHLYFIQEHHEFSKLYIMELWTNPRFGNTNAYSLFDKYRQRLKDLIEAGINEGLFDRRLNLDLCVCMVFGTVNHMLLSAVVLEKPLNMIAQAEKVYDLFNNAMDASNYPKENSIQEENQRRRQILEGALLEFNELGYQGATITKIAKRAGVTEPTIYEYFKNKQELLYSIPESAMQGFLATLDSDLQIQDTPLHHFYIFLRHQITSVRDAPLYYKILIMELRCNKEFYKSSGYQSLRKYSSYFINIVKKAIDQEIFRKDLDLTIVRDFYFGTFDEITLLLLMQEKPNRIVEQTENIFMMMYHALKIYKKCE